MNIFEKFKNKNNSKPIIKRNNKIYYTNDILPLLQANINFLIENPNKNVVILSDDIFDFFINFFAALYAEKEIFLLPDIKKTKLIDFDFILLDKAIYEKAEPDKLREIDFAKNYINFFTSGSTGIPKAVKHSLENFVKESIELTGYFKKYLYEEQEFVTTTRLTHLFPFAYYFIFGLWNDFLLNADKIYYTEQIHNKNFVLVSTPSFLEKVVKYETDKESLPKLIFTAGDKLKEYCYKYFENYSVILNSYGSTETCTIGYSTSFNDSVIIKLDSVKIEKQKDKTILKSDFILEEYTLMNDDIEFIDENNFRLNGRKDRILKIQEKRINAIEIENQLNKNEFVKESYCFKYSDKMAALIVLNSKGIDYYIKNSSADIVKILKNSVSEISEIIPQKFRFVHAIPKNQMSKTDKEQIEKIFSINLSLPIVLDIKEDTNKLVIKLIFHRNSNFFKGHFDVMPILPGVVQLYFAQWFSEINFSNTNIKQAKKIKFSHIIKPDTEVNLILENNETSINYTYMGDDKVFSSGILEKE